MAKKKPDAAPFAERIASAYATEGAALGLGRAVLDGTTHPDAVVQIPAAMVNRHGLIAGATGTGKTKTLQLMAEQLSAMGVPVFAADIKGDLSGVSQPGATSDRVTSRAQDLGVEWSGAGFPTSFLSLGGLGPGVPVRATVSSFGPQLLAKVLGANETQEASLSLVFRYADQNNLALLDLDDLREVLKFLDSDEGKADLKEIGGLAPATVGVLLRSIIELEDQGGEAFFGEPELAVADLMRTTSDGRGVINCLELAAVQDKPKLFSTFLMWLLAELFHDLPEVGDLDKPKLVFFFDEAHLLFADASKEFLESGRADRAAHPVQGRRRLLRHAAARRRARAGPGPARQPGPARPAGLHPPRRQGAQGRGHDLSEDRRLRPRGGPHAARHRRGDGHDPLRARARRRRWSGRSSARPSRSWPRSATPT